MREGHELKPINKMISKDMVLNYSEVSGDRNPIHIDESFAKNTDFGGIIAHGMLLISSISEMLILNFGIPWAESGRLKIKFRKPLPVGEEINTKGKISKIDNNNDGSLITCEVMCTDKDANILISGTAYLKIERGVQ